MKSLLPRTLSAVPRLPHVQFEIVKAIQVLLDQHAQPLPTAEKAVISALDEEVGRELRDACRQWLLARSRLHAASLKATKVAIDDPIHPGWPARTPDSKGGQFRPKDGETVVAANTPGIGHNQGPPFVEPPPPIPPKPPAIARVFNNFIKAAAYWLAVAGKGLAARYLNVLQEVYWVTTLALPYIRAYLSPPKTLQELQQDVLNPQAGYDIHHIVEQTPARKEGFSDDIIDGPDNLVRIPTLKHWQINAWFQTKNPDYGDISPRDYLRGKSWEERRRVGIDALTRFGVLKL
jgi:hypothetical protein